MKRSTACFLGIAVCAGTWVSIVTFTDVAKSLNKEGDYPDTVARFETAMAETNLVRADAIMDSSLSWHNRLIARERINYAKKQQPANPFDQFDGVAVTFRPEEFSIAEVLGPPPNPLHIITRTQVYGKALAWGSLHFIGVFTVCFAALLLSKFLLLNGARLGTAGARNSWHFFLARVGELSRAIKNHDTDKS